MTMNDRLVDSFLPKPGGVSHPAFGIERAPVDMSGTGDGTEGLVRIFETASGAAESSGKVSVNRATAPSKTVDEIPDLNDYFTFQPKSGSDGSDDVVWTHHYQGVDIPEEEIPVDSLARLKEWLRKFVAESEARQAKEKEEEEMRRVAARLARRKREAEREALKKQQEEEARRIEEEETKIEAESRKKKQELENADEIAKAAKRKDEEEHQAIIEDVKRLKLEQVHCLSKFSSCRSSIILL